MNIELDHIFIFVAEGAPEAQALIDFGFVEGQPNVHPGQGTSNRRFFFNNMMLELLWVSHVDEVQRELTRPTMFWQRWKGRTSNACPFGIIVRTPTGATPFDHWHYRPDYLPAGLSFAVANNAPQLNEPLVFVMPAGSQSVLPTQDQPRQGQLSFNTVTAVTIAMPDSSDKSSALEQLRSETIISFTSATEQVMEIVFDDGAQNQSKDFRPRLPLILKW